MVILSARFGLSWELPAYLYLEVKGRRQTVRAYIVTGLTTSEPSP